LNRHNPHKWVNFRSAPTALGAQTKLVAPDATVVVIKNSGHWILEEQPGETIAAITRFLQ
jgi:pimeloyl-ACP methyl ester carboxylesterase